MHCKTKRSHGQVGSSCWWPAVWRGDFGRWRCDVAGRGNASGVGRAAGGRAGGQVVRVGWQGGSWRPERSPARGWRAA
jgi:hypothetical protein